MCVYVCVLSELSLSTNYIHYGVWKTMRNFFFLYLQSVHYNRIVKRIILYVFVYLNVYALSVLIRFT